MCPLMLVHLRNKTSSPCLYKPGENRGERLGEFNSKINENPRHSREFSPALEFSQTLTKFLS